METKTIQAQEFKFKADPAQMLQYVFYIKAQMKQLEQELKDNEDMVIALLETRDGQISLIDDDVHGKASIVITKSYKYSDEVNELILQKKTLENKIKAKQMVEIASGAEVDSIKRYVRYNVDFR